MKIVSWNCNMAFRKKWTKILSEEPDLLIIQECENQEKLEPGNLIPKATDFIWEGKNKSKGIGIFSYSQFTLKIHESYTSEYSYVLPIEVKGEYDFIMLAVWAMPHLTTPSLGYVGQIWRAVNYYQTIINERTIIIGDFNSNIQWDYMRKTGNHSDLVNFLSKRNILSLYHQQNQLAHGKELDPSFFFYKNKEKPYHIDFCFSSTEMINTNTEISIGQYDDWIKLSDHMPLIIDKLG